MKRLFTPVAPALMFFLLLLGLFLHFDSPFLWSDEPKAEKGAQKADVPGAKVEDPSKKAKPDPSGANVNDGSAVGDRPEIKELDPDSATPKDVVGNVNAINKLADGIASGVGKNRSAINMMWTLITGFLVMFMQAGFALVETGLTRAKNVVHTMAMNIMIYGIGMLGFWLVGFAIMFGGYNSEAVGGGFLGGDANLLVSEYKITLFGKPFGLFGYDGFLLLGRAFDVTMMTLFLFQMVFMDTAATIPTGAMAERWKFLSFVLYGLVISAIIYPVYGNWVWGGGWLAKLGANFGLGHGHVDFAGSSVVHMVGGLTALAGAMILGPRIGKYNKDGTINVLPAHNVPMYVLGTLILAFGWFGFNPGSTLAAADLNIGRIAANTMLASAAGMVSATFYMWTVFKKPDPSFMCNGMLAGLVAVTAPCAFIAPWAAVVIGLVAGILVVWACLFLERVARVDDPVGAVGVHGVNGAWGVLSLGLFADGTYGQGWNGSFWYKLADGTLKWEAEKLQDLPAGVTEQGVTGLFYGNTSQFIAECIGVGTNIVWVFVAAYASFWLIGKLVGGNRVSAAVELQGLDVPELGVQGYITDDPKVPEGHVMHPSAEPRAASVPGGGEKRFTVVVDGADAQSLAECWSGLCRPSEQAAPADLLAVYPNMTTLQGNRFHFRGGDREKIRQSVERLFKSQLQGQAVRARLE